MSASPSSRSRVLLFCASLLVTLSVCGRESPVAPDEPGPMSLRVVSGDGQRAQFGTELPKPVVVQALNAKGKPIKGQLVNFVVVEGGGSVYAGSSITNNDGVAQEWWTMGPNLGRNRLEVRAVDPTTGEKQNFATLTATATPVPVARIEMHTIEATVGVGETVQFTATLFDAAGNEVTDREVTWSSSNSAIASVTEGVVLGKAVGGPVTITITSEGKTATARVTVVAARVYSVFVEPAYPEIALGATVQLTVTLYDIAGNVLTGRGYAFSSTAEDIATVSSTGLVTGQGDGAAYIYVTSESATGAAYVRVLAPIASMTISPSSVNVQEGYDVFLDLDIRDASNNRLLYRDVTWTVSDPAILYVVGAFSDGMHARGLSRGGPITVTATADGFSATALVTVLGNEPDVYEPNNSGLSAYMLGTVGDDDSQDLVVNPTIHNGGDQDWFRVVATERSSSTCFPGSAQRFRFRVGLSQLPADYELEVRRDSPDGELVGGSYQGGTNPEEVTILVNGTCGTADDFTFYINVFAYGITNSPLPYRLAMRFSRF